EPASVHLELPRDQRAEVLGRLRASAHPDEVDDLRRVLEGVLDLLGQVGAGAAADGDVVHVLDPGAGGIQAGLDRLTGEAAAALDAVQALFGDGEAQLAVLDDCGGAVAVEEVQSEDQHTPHRISPPASPAAELCAGFFLLLSLLHSYPCILPKGCQ